MKKILAGFICFFVFIFSIKAQTLYGTTYQGGSNNVGVLFSFDLSSSTYTKLRDFDSTNGDFVNGSLMQAANGKLYGMTLFGGSSDYGVIFSFDPSSATYAKLMDFDLFTKGGRPFGTLVQASDGKLYGMTGDGGGYGYGVIFSFDPMFSTYTKLMDFDNTTNGGAPSGSLVKAGNGKLYGMTSYGGSDNFGVIFSFDPSSSTYTKLKDFDYYNDGGHPFGNLIQASDGKFYGMTYDGGSNQAGVIFSFDPASSTYIKLKDFEFNDTEFFFIDGDYPYGSLIQAGDGKLYGMTHDGGSSNYGVIFSFDISTATFTKLKDFDNVNGANPYGSLMQASNGKFYGMTSDGGSSANGVIFSYDAIDSIYTKLIDYNGANGYYPYIGSAFIEIPESGPVPVTLISFTGKNNRTSNQLSWKVDNEQNLNYYELQRSIDGQNFKSVAQIKAVQNNNYTYSDPIAAAVSSLYYYRLKSVDNDGRFKYSMVIKIRTDHKGLATVNPNPFKNKLVVKIESLIRDKAIFIITDISGRQLYKENKLLFSGTNIVELSKTSGLSTGTYLLTVIVSQEIQSIKVIKGN